MTCRSLPIIITLAFLVSSASAQSNNELFEKMVGREVRMDPEIVAQVLKAEPGARVTVDSDGDGLIDCLYFVDTDDRHQGRYAPLLVKVIDEDGDMNRTGEGDLDSDLYVADWYGDGTIDRVIDYIDLDHDNDLDEQVLYQWSDMAHFLAQSPKNYGGKSYCAAWARDYGDDNRLWYDINYEYSQQSTEWLTDFNGDEMFVYAFFYNYEQDRFFPGFENPFAFYDLDNDSCSEEVVRFGGEDLSANTLRYSMDIDNDSHGENRHDYDFSISAIGPVGYPAEKCMTLSLRGRETGPVLRWELVRQVAKSGNWAQAHLTWDENDNNIEPVEGRQHHERWEGVINYRNEYFPQVGGPSGGPYNKRNEVDTDGCTLQFYYSPVDHRLHLFGAEVGWIHVDYDYDNRADMLICMEDADKNGFFDTWSFDVNADSIFERTYTSDSDTVQLYPFDYDTLHDLYVPSLGEAVDGNQKLIIALKAALMKRERDFAIDPVEEYFSTSLAGYGSSFHLGEKIRNSMEGARYYGDLIRERYWQRFAAAQKADEPSFVSIRQAYETGDHSRAADLINRHLIGKPLQQRFGSYTKRFAFEITNPSDRYLDNHPIIVCIGDIKKTVPDFDPRRFVITDAAPLIDWRVVPSQADDFGSDGWPDEIAFVKTLMPLSAAKLYCWYAPGGSDSISYAVKTDTHRDWLPVKVNIGWESNLCGYRMYYGQIDFFGKRLEGLRLKNTTETYHRISDWGMDVLHVGRSSGLGGISLWEGERRIPVMNPMGEGSIKIERTIVSDGPVRALVKVVFSNIRSESAEYTVTMMMSAFADNRFSRQDITITSSAGDSVVYSPGLMKIPNDTWRLDTGTGVLASWGLSDHEIGDIGLGLMFEPGEYCGFTETELDRCVKLTAPAGKRVNHWILGGWRKGFASPVAPSSSDWAKQVEETGLRLRTPVRVRFSSE